MTKKDLSIVLFILNMAIDHHVHAKAFVRLDSDVQTIDKSIDILKTVKQSMIYMFSEIHTSDKKPLKSKKVIIKDTELIKL